MDAARGSGDTRVKPANQMAGVNSDGAVNGRAWARSMVEAARGGCLLPPAMGSVRCESAPKGGAGAWGGCD